MVQSDRIPQVDCCVPKPGLWMVLSLLAACSVSPLAWGTPIEAVAPIREKIVEPVQDLCKVVRKLAEASPDDARVIAGMVVPAATQFDASVGPGIQLVIKEEIRRLEKSGAGIRLSEPGPRRNFAIEGRYRLVSQPVGGQKDVDEITAFQLDLSLIGKDGVARLNKTITLTAEHFVHARVFAGLVAWVMGCDFTPLEEKVPPEAKVLWGNNKVWLSYARSAAPKPSSKYRVVIVVKTGKKDAKGRDLFEERPIREQGGQRFVDLKLGEVFRVVLVNHSGDDAVAELTLDGVNALAFSNDWATKGPKERTVSFLVSKAANGQSGEPGRSEISGWLRTIEHSDEFLVVAAGKGIAHQAGANPCQIGLITARFAPAWTEPPREVGAKGVESLEIGRGQLIDAKYETIRRYVGDEWTSLTVRYEKPAASDKPRQEPASKR